MYSLQRALIEFPSRMRAGFQRLLTPLIFRSLGKGGMIMGRQNFAHPRLNVSVGDDYMFGGGTFWQVAQQAQVTIGRRASINYHCFVVCSDKITIGDNVAIGEFVSIRDQEHNFSPENGVRDQGYRTAPIVIEDNCWIGRGVYIGPGSHIGSGSIVAANSVVRGKFPPNSLIAGAPATVKRTIPTD